MDRLMQVIIREDFEQEDAMNLSACLCYILHSHFESNIMPQEIDEEYVFKLLGAVIQRPLMVLEAPACILIVYYHLF